MTPRIRLFLLSLTALALVAPELVAQRPGARPTPREVVRERIAEDGVPARKPAPPAAATPTTPTEPPRTSGRYRVSIPSFTVNRQTWDDALQRDGKGDEVKLKAEVMLYTKAPYEAVRVAQMYTTNQLGDVNGHPDWWTRAGSASDKGGLVSGDGVNSIPWMTMRHEQPGAPWEKNIQTLWEGELVQGQQVLAILPSVWEYDGDEKYHTDWAGRFVTQVRLWNSTLHLRRYLDHGSAEAFEPRLHDPADNTQVALPISGMEAADRPIGALHANATHAYWHQKMVVLTVKSIEAALAGRSEAMIPVNYKDREDWKGDYTIWVKVERLP